MIPELADVFGPVGAKVLDGLELAEPYASRLASQRRVMALMSAEITQVETEVARRLKDDPAYRALLTIAGIGPVLAAIFVAEIGDVHRFAGPDQLTCWAGLTTRIDSWDRRRREGHVSKQGSRLLRWAAVEACQRAREPYLADKRRAILARRGRKAAHIATVATARHLMKVVYYTMRDGRARCLTARSTTAPARGRPAPDRGVRARSGSHDPPPVGSTGRGRGRLHVIDPAVVVTAAPLHATTRVAKECPAPPGATIHAQPLERHTPPHASTGAAWFAVATGRWTSCVASSTCALRTRLSSDLAAQPVPAGGDQPLPAGVGAGQGRARGTSLRIVRPTLG